MKSNNLPELSKEIINQGYGLDVSSGYELKAAIDAGARDIIFSGPGKTDSELKSAIDYSDRVTLLIDSEGEYRRLSALLERVEKSIGIGIRLNNNPNGLWRKFGVDPDALPDLYEAVKENPRVNLKGIQFHSSWNLVPDRQVAFIEQLGQLFSKMPKAFLTACEFIDIGGGYWPPQGEWLLSKEYGQYDINPGLAIDEFARRLSGAVKDSLLKYTDARICFEPGRWICNDAMHILVSVIDKKGSDLVITDAGTNMVGWERFETDYFPVLNLSRPDETERRCHILGSLCTPHDVWGYNYMGKDIQQGDRLMIPTQGAYTYSLRQNFIKPLPPVAVIDHDTVPYLV